MLGVGPSMALLLRHRLSGFYVIPCLIYECFQNVASVNQALAAMNFEQIQAVNHRFYRLCSNKKELPKQ